PHVVEMAMGEKDRGGGEIVLGQHLVEWPGGFLPRIDDHTFTTGRRCEHIAIRLKWPGGKRGDEHGKSSCPRSGRLYGVGVTPGTKPTEAGCGRRPGGDDPHLV